MFAWHQNRPHISLRGYLILLVISALFPVVVFAGVVFARYYDSELARIEEDLQNDARKLALRIAGLNMRLVLRPRCMMTTPDMRTVHAELQLIVQDML